MRQMFTPLIYYNNVRGFKVFAPQAECRSLHKLMSQGLHLIRCSSSVLTNIRYLRSEIVKVTVTNETSGTEYFMHAQVLCNESPYFAAMKNFSEGVNSAVELKEMDPDAFDIVANWFYRETIRGAKSWADFDMLVRAYGVADRLMMRACRSDILESIKGFCSKERLRPRNLLVISRLGLPKESGIVQFATDQFVFEMSRMVQAGSPSYTLDGADIEFFTAGGELVVVLVEKMLKALECFTPKAGARSTYNGRPPYSATV